MAHGKISYLGVVDITAERIVLTPECRDAAHRVGIMADLVAIEAPHSFYPDNLLFASTTPSYVLRYLVEGHFESIVKERGNEQERAAAHEALAQGPYTGVQYVVSLTPMSGSAFSFPRAELIAIRNGDTWHDPWGRPIGEEERAAASQTALTDLQTQEAIQPS